MSRNDSAFYTYGDNGVVWQEEDNPLAVICLGEMRIHAKDTDGSIRVIRYTNQLEEFGITNDEQLAEWSAKGDEVFCWIHNSWFEIYHETDIDFMSGVFDDLEQAIAWAKENKERETNERNNR